MDVELALKINRLVHNECKEVPHDIGIRIEELVRLHQMEQLQSFVSGFYQWHRQQNYVSVKRIDWDEYIKTL